MTILNGNLQSVLGTPFGGPGYAVLIKSRMTRRSSGGSVILPLIDRIPMPAEEDGGDGEFTTSLLDPGPVRVELSGSDRHGDGWDITVPEGAGPFELADLIDVQTEWSPMVVSRAEAAARRAESSASNAALSAGAAGDSAVEADGHAQSAGQSATLAGEHAEATGDDRRQTGLDRQHVDTTKEMVDDTSAAAIVAAQIVYDLYSGEAGDGGQLLIEHPAASLLYPLADGNNLVAFDPAETATGLPPEVEQRLEAHFGGAGTAPHIGPNGNWWVGETDTGTPAQGPPGTGTGGGGGVNLVEDPPGSGLFMIGA